MWVGTIVLTLFLFSAEVRGQAVAEYFRDIAGTPFFPRTYVDVNGTPYLFDDFQVSNITLFNGNVLKNIRVNFNLVTNELLYVDEKGATMVASILTIKNIDVGFRKFAPTQAKNAYCEVLSTEGKATLVKIYKKKIIETKAFNSATAERKFLLDDSYAVLVGTKFTEVNSADDLYEVLGPEIKDYSKKEKLKAKSANSWIKIVNYYNAI